MNNILEYLMKKSVLEDYIPYKVINNWKSVEVKSIHSTDNEAMKALNTLIGYCVSKWMKSWDYKDTKDLCINLIPWVELLRAKSFNSNL